MFNADGWWWREYLKELSSVEILCDWVVFQLYLGVSTAYIKTFEYYRGRIFYI